jgi:hypothetical protein
LIHFLTKPDGWYQVNRTDAALQGSSCAGVLLKVMDAKGCILYSYTAISSYDYSLSFREFLCPLPIAYSA